MSEEVEPVRKGVGPWPGGEGNWPEEPWYDPEFLRDGDRRNVEDRFRYWRMSAIREQLDREALGLEVAVENLGHDFNIGSIVRTANGMGVRRVHIVGKRRWNRRGAMVTDRYLEVVHHPSVEEFLEDVTGRGLEVVGVDNTEGSVSLEGTSLRKETVLVMGEESSGLSAEMVAACNRVLHITQFGSTRSINVGHAAAIAMWAWGVQNRSW
ncbi:TrmH family RNA methyltransferase [Gleimia hominis]|uniref:TrmH family RNA methyltransferase n=1 Tax=Gleimia hominis TaxID=595468 RepID=UPI000C7FA9E7|nr:RNA methyltransferase [Gleimia hominis]WIK64470.1 RNA methyltransferase [Gleimia hominis]